MSTVYVLEPPTKGKVILTTSKGPLDIELWPKEAPKAVRNFVQLCLEGYYDNTIFHRVIKSFLIQGGDPTGTGEGGESIYGSGFSDEFHSRLRFKHRGLVACANKPDTPNSNGSQFFITLDRCDGLDKKHTIFGKITGDSIYNLLTLSEVECDKNDRPLDPLPKILSAEVLWNPFDDMVPRVISTKSSLLSEKKEPKQKAVKKLNLLSFGDEAEEEEKELLAANPRIKSSHDVLNDPRLLKDGLEKDLNSAEEQKSRESQLMVREALAKKQHKEELGAGTSDSPDHSDEDELSFDVRMRQQILRRRQEIGDKPTKKDLRNERTSSQKRATSPPASRSRVDEHDEKPKADKLSIKKKGLGSEVRAERLDNADADLQLLGEAERSRQLHKQKKRRRQGHEEDVLTKLENFKSAFSTKFKGSNGDDAGAKDEDVSGWMGVELKFAPEPGKNNMSRSNDPNDYVVHDPLLEKGKEKFNKMQAKEKRRQREWAGKSLT
ncbi:cytochrome P450 monooxygenase 57, variant 2 [Salvia divinorum]|uniref:Cytochrome P450 monooxygenase 57, variant 2 n=1 Tax=Salvia divinorum TaxID=28513 RepID=A0ABD1H838_SALDI